MDVLAAVEYDPLCAAVHRYNFPRTELICADVGAVSARAVKAAATTGWKAHGHQAEWDGRLDVVIGGPPCQGFSTIGKRAFDDPRNQLVFAFARLVGSLKPRYFLMENVPGLASVRAGGHASSPRLLDLLFEEFAAFGYTILEPQTLNAYNYGVPQDRRRMLLIGWHDGEVEPAYPEAETRGRARSGQETRKEPGDKQDLPLCPSVWDAIGDVPNLDDHEESEFSDEIPVPSQPPDSLDRERSLYAQHMSGTRAEEKDRAYPRRWDRSTLTSSYRTCHAAPVVERFRATQPGHPEAVSRFFRLHRDGASPTLRAGTHYDRGSFNAPRPIHPAHPRVISVREAARLHSFPDWFRLHWTKWHGFREVGNSLPPRLGRAVAVQIVAALGAAPRRPTKPIELGEPELLYLENVGAAKMFDADLTRIPRNALRARRRAA